MERTVRTQGYAYYSGQDLPVASDNENSNSIIQHTLRRILSLDLNPADISTQREFFSKSYQINQKSYWLYHFPIDLDPNERPFGSKSIGK